MASFLWCISCNYIFETKQSFVALGLGKEEQLSRKDYEDYCKHKTALCIIIMNKKKHMRWSDLHVQEFRHLNAYES